MFEKVASVLSPVVDWLNLDFSTVEATESTLLRLFPHILVSLALPTVVSLVSGVTAPYGRYFSDNKSFLFRWKANGKVAWIVQESPCLIIGTSILALFARQECLASPANLVLFGMFMLHYVHRTLIFPMNIRGGKPTPVFTAFLAFLFCVMNGFLQTDWLLRATVYPQDWIYDPRFIAGVTLFFAGMAINMHADYTLINLRKPGETGYKIPHGGMFEFVSGANFFGEIVEWFGFALAGWAYAPLAFAIFTMCNIGPRGYHHHQWYLSKFKEDYPKNRKAIIPFIW